ncbi:MAG: LamG-like jellyroll fold domain-containing protein [Candidatus Nanopelagicales bacterium]
MRINVAVQRVAIGMGLALLAGGLIGVVPAQADTLPPDPGTPTTFSADPLPTVQIDGVVWSQAIIGNKVYAAGNFATARPAGSAAGVNTVVRSNLLAYDITTGVLDSTFLASANAQVRAIKAAPDGSKLFIGGDFTQVNGVARARIAAVNPTTGALVSAFNPPAVNSPVRALEVSANALYLGGTFTAVSTSARRFAAAVNPTTGALLPWDPSPDSTVFSFTLNHSKSKLIMGGMFQNIGTTPAQGLGALDPASGAVLPWATTNVVRNVGPNAAITSLTSDADGVYGTGFVFGSTGNLEGAFRADNETGEIIWLQDCHGDHVASYPLDDVVYFASHAHYCGNVGGFPQTQPWTMYHSTAFTKQATGTVKGPDPYGYFNFGGNPAPTLLNWFPKWWGAGSYTGQGNAGWSITGAGKYMAYGGEFTAVNSRFQQGLVRFAKTDIAPNKEGPVPDDGLTPSATSVRAGEVRIGWQAAHDRDNELLTYKVYRNYTALTNTPVCETTAQSTFWNRPSLSCTDKTAVPGTEYNYRVFAFDPFGNRATRNTTSVTVATLENQSLYAGAILDSSPSLYYRLDETSGTRVADFASANHGVASSGVVRNTPGAMLNESNSSSTFAGTGDSYVASTISEPGPDTFSVEAWFRTTSSEGGKIVGFGNSATGNSSSYDRHVYMDNSGRVVFGVYTGQTVTLESRPGFNDGSWHQVVASMGADGMTLYIDGRRVASRADTTVGQPYNGYWRVGGDNLNGWPNGPSSFYFAGAIDDVSVFPTVLTREDVNAHYVASGRESNLPTRPSDSYGAAVFDLDPQIYYRLEETTGSVAKDTGPAGNNGNISAGVTLGEQGALEGTSTTSAGFDGTQGAVIASASDTNPRDFSTSIWFKTTTDRGGKLIGFGSDPAGLSSAHDRDVYMQDDGKVVFGVWTGQAQVIVTDTALNDGAWHNVVATQSGSGMALFVDGRIAGTNPETNAQDYTGYWRIGGGTTWDSSSPYVAGTLDEAAVFSRALNAEEIASLYSLASGKVIPRPTDAYGGAMFDLNPDVFWRLDEPSGQIARDSGPAANDGRASNGVAFAQEGALADSTTTAASFDGSEGTVIAMVGANNPTGYSTSVWFKTTTTQGGKLIGFGRAASGLSSSYDRHVYMQDDGRLVFGVWTGQTNTVTTPNPLNDGAWHNVVSTQSDDGMALYVDGQLVGTNPQTQAQDYPGYWRIGGDRTWGSSSAFFAGTLDEAAVFGRALTAEEVGLLYTVGSGDLPNQAPVAKFSSSVDRLKVSVDGSESKDSDGSVASYAWEFGDGSPAVTGAEVKVDHTYAEAGTYTITLVVTDDEGAVSEAVTKDVPVVGNEAPVAKFSSSVDRLKVSVDGSESRDSDGSVASYAWEFGDGSPAVTGAEVKVDHTYAEAGTYTITLVVTDDEGAVSEAVAKDVTVADTAFLARDGFDRTVATGFGAAEIGGNWTTLSTPSDYSVSGGWANLRIPTAGRTRAAELASVSSTSTDVTARVSVDKPITGGGLYLSLTGRGSNENGYAGRIRIQSNGAVSAFLQSVVANSEKNLRSASVPGLTFAESDSLIMRVQVTGTNPTTLRMKVWKQGTGEPSDWLLTTTDDTGSLQGAGGLAFRAYLSGSADNAPVTVRLDDFEGQTP